MVVAVLFLLHIGAALAHSAEYYTMVHDILSRPEKNYYELLGMSRLYEFKLSELKKRYHAMSKEKHPDRNPSPTAQEEFMALAHAYNILSNQLTREEYDDLLDNGVPMHEQYYGQYAHRFGAPDHDIRWVLLSVILLMTALKYGIALNNYHGVIESARNHPQYKIRVGERMKQLIGEQNRALDPSSAAYKKKVKEMRNDEQIRMQAERDCTIEVVGAKQPTWRDLFVVEMVLDWPASVGKFLYQLLILQDVKVITHMWDGICTLSPPCVCVYITRKQKRHGVEGEGERRRGAAVERDGGDAGQQ